MTAPLVDYLQQVETVSRNADVGNFYLWPRTPLTDDHQEKIVERVGVSDHEVADPRSRPALIIAALRQLLRIDAMAPGFSLIDIACGDAIVLWQIKKAFPASHCFGVECNLSFPMHQQARADGVQISFGLIQHLFAEPPPQPFDVSLMLNSYRGWESADLRDHERNLPQLADAWFARHSRFTVVTATTTQIERLKANGFSVVVLGKGEDNSLMIIMSAQVAFGQ